MYMLKTRPKKNEKLDEEKKYHKNEIQTNEKYWINIYGETKCSTELDKCEVGGGERKCFLCVSFLYSFLLLPILGFAIVSFILPFSLLSAIGHYFTIVLCVAVRAFNILNKMLNMCFPRSYCMLCQFHVFYVFEMG